MKYKEIIKATVLTACDHPTAEEIFLRAKAQCPKMSMATVYNNLKVLTDEGVIKRIPMGGSGDRYDNLIPHAHLVCLECSSVVDTMFEDVTDVLSEKSGVSPLGYDLKIFYLCDSCKAPFKQKECGIQ